MATGTASATSTAITNEVDIRSFLRVKTASDANQDVCEESVEATSKKRRLHFKDITGKSIAVGGVVVVDEKLDENGEVSGVKASTCIVVGDDVADDEKSCEDKNEVSGVKAAPCIMQIVGDDVADGEKSCEDKNEVSGVMAAPCMMQIVGDDVADGEKSCEDKDEVSGVKVAPCMMQIVGDDVADGEKSCEDKDEVSGVHVLSYSASGKGLDSNFL